MDSQRDYKLKNDNSHLVAALTCIGDGVITTDITGTINFMNKSAEQLTEWKLSEATGKSIDTVFSLVDIDTLQPFKSPVKDTLESGERVGLRRNTALLTKNNYKFYISASCSPILDTNNKLCGAVVVFRDITRIRTMEEEIKTERNNLKLTIEAIPAGLLLVDNHMIIKQVNQQLLDFLDVDNSLVLNQKLGDGMFCINSMEDGCEKGINCTFCELRKIIKEVLLSGESCKDVILQHTIIKNGMTIAPWIKLNFVPVTIAGNKYVMILLDDITDLKKREEQLIRMKDFTYKLLDRFPMMVWRSDTNDKNDFLNQTWLEYTGMYLEEGLEVGWSKALHPDELDWFLNKQQDAFKKRIPFECEHRMRRHDGEYRWVVSMGIPYYDLDEKYAGFIGAVYDIHDRKTAEYALTISKEKYRQLFQNATENHKKYQSLFMNMSDAFLLAKYVYHTDGNLIDFELIEANHSFEKMFNLDLEKSIGHKTSEVFPEFLADFLQRIKRANGEKGTFEKLSYEYKSTKSYRWFSISAFIPSEGLITVIVSEITDNKLAESYLLNTQEVLRKAKDDAEAANRSKSEFLANMSHEIRTPINGITGMIDLTLMSKLEDDQKKNLNAAKNCADSLLIIINDILDFSKLEAGKFKVIKSDFNIDTMLEETNKIHSIRAKEKSLELIYMIDQNIPKYLFGDSNRLQQVLNNLINNAIKFTDSGEVVIEVKEKSRERDQVNIEFSVIDTGIGISQANISKLFKSFSQIDGSYTRRHKGTGLGLIISKQLIEMMGGDIWVESIEGKGSKFTFVLPFQIRDNKIQPVNQKKAYESKNKYDILLAEDDMINQTFLSGILTKNGHRVVVANNGKDAFDAYMKDKFDLILMDILMPTMDGVEAFKLIREQESVRGHIPVIALTAFALIGDREKYINLGMNEYVSKPVKMDELLFVMDKVMTYNEKEIDFTEKPVINHAGELVFVNTSNMLSSEEFTPILSQLDIFMKELHNLVVANNLFQIEETVHSIKELFNLLDNQELKDLAFKIELSVRKGNFYDILKNTELMRDKFELLKKSWNL